jgi:hypothetical protein
MKHWPGGARVFLIKDSGKAMRPSRVEFRDKRLAIKL